MKKTLIKGLEYYLSLAYKYEIERDDEGEYVGHIPLLPGCVADGRTPSEAAANLQIAQKSWIEARLESNLPIPEPQTVFSGKWLVRTTPSLHRKITEFAERDNVSMNQFVNNVLAGFVGAREAIAGLCNQPFRVQFANVPSGAYLVMGNRAMGAMIWAQAQGVSSNLEPAVERPEAPALPVSCEMRA